MARREDVSFLDRSLSVAKSGHSRWLSVPSALAVHLCIGQAYAFSVFNLPMTRLLGLSAPATGDWTLPEVSWTFSIAIVFLGLSAALCGRWVELRGPRCTMFAAAILFSAGLLVSSAGVAIHSLWTVYLGYGVLGGCGLGIGYISPVSTLLKWFPDRPGMATGLAIMGFGGGALLAAPFEVWLMSVLHGPSSSGVAGTFALLGVVYLAVMVAAALTIRVPAQDWIPPGQDVADRRLLSPPFLDAAAATRTPQFWLLWTMLCVNVTAGIAVLGQASPMIQEMFPGRVSAAEAAAFVSLLSLFNMGGRFFWSTVSDYIGRPATYGAFFLLGMVLYSSVPSLGHMGSLTLFTLAVGVILSMYGGGFATIPAYLRDVFGTLQVGAIHGRLLTAWSVAGVLGPVCVSYMREWQISRGVPKAEAYSTTMYLMAALLLAGLVCNLLVGAIHRRQTVLLPAK
jgi:MFS family permease